MGKSFSLGVVIGAALSGTFGRTVGGAKGKLVELGAEVRKLSRDAGLVERWKKDKEALAAALTAAGKTKEEIGRLKAAVDRSEAAMQKAGVSVAKYGQNYVKLGETLGRVRSQHERLQRSEERMTWAKERLGTVRNAALVEVGAIYGGMRLVKEAADFGYQLRLFGNTAQITDARLAGVKERLFEIAKWSHQTPGALLEGLNVLVGKGLDLNRSMVMLPGLAKTATASAAEMANIAEMSFPMVIGMKIADKDVYSIQNMLAKQGKLGGFETRDMAAVFPGLMAKAPSLGLVGREGIATLGASLQVATMGETDKPVAANNFMNFLTKLTAPDTIKKFDDAGVSIERLMKKARAEGKDPMVAMVNQIQKMTRGDAFRIGELFGDMQVKAFLDAMLQHRDAFDVIRAAGLDAGDVLGIDFSANIATTTEKMKGASIATWKLREALGDAMAPAVGRVSDALVPLIERMGTVIHQVPALGDVLVGGAVVGGGVISALGMFAGAVWTVEKAVKAWAFAQKGLNAAWAASPVGAVLVAAGAIKVLADHYRAEREAESAADKKRRANPFALPYSKTPDVARVFPRVVAGAALVTGSALAAPAATLPPPPPPSAASAAVSMTVNAPITVHATPGMDARQVAQEVRNQLRESEQQAAARARSALFDGWGSL